MALSIDAARARATVGEITDAMEEVNMPAIYMLIRALLTFSLAYCPSGSRIAQIYTKQRSLPAFRKQIKTHKRLKY